VVGIIITAKSKYSFPNSTLAKIANKAQLSAIIINGTIGTPNTIGGRVKALKIGSGVNIEYLF